jgi:antimicrobial peptide system SdpA family protein
VNREKNIVGAATIAYWLGAATVGFLLIHGAAWPEGLAPLSTGVEKRVMAFTGVQESWQFFERDLKIEQVLVARRAGDGSWSVVAPVPNASAENLFGVSRRPRKDAVERNRLLTLVAKDQWQSCTGELGPCVEAAPTIALTNPAPSPAYCGSLTLVRKETPHWAWATSKVLRPFFFVRVDVTC